jgi:hypothetical protein
LDPTLYSLHLQEASQSLQQLHSEGLPTTLRLSITTTGEADPSYTCKIKKAEQTEEPRRRTRSAPENPAPTNRPVTKATSAHTEGRLKHTPDTATTRRLRQHISAKEATCKKTTTSKEGEEPAKSISSGNTRSIHNTTPKSSNKHRDKNNRKKRGLHYKQPNNEARAHRKPTPNKTAEPPFGTTEYEGDGRGQTSKFSPPPLANIVKTPQ